MRVTRGLGVYHVSIRFIYQNYQKDPTKIKHIFRKIVHIKKKNQWSPKGQLISEAFFLLQISQKANEIL